MRTSLIILLLTGFLSSSLAQYPVFTQEIQQTYNYEDQSDFLRRYPGMYALDYGTLGAPMLFRPWNMHPWELTVWRDGIPMNRKGDGLYDSNLQPLSELDNTRYSYLEGHGGGEFHLETRTFPVDTPYTELQIREGYYGYGTVDFAHAQRLKDSLTMEVSGRLGWYDGLRNSANASTLSRLNRLRGCFRFNLTPRWRAKFVYEGSRINADTDISEFKPIAPREYFTEREQAIAAIDERDSLRTRWSPSLSLFVRQDREEWESYYRMREATQGWVARLAVPLLRQKLWFRQTGMLTSFDSYTIKNYRELFLELQAVDSIDVKAGYLVVNASMRRESAFEASDESEWSPLVGGGVEFRSRRVRDISLLGGVQYTESLIPIQWVKDEYPILNRPLPIDPAFYTINATTGKMVSAYMGSYQSDETRGIDRYLKTQIGLDWRYEGYSVTPMLQILSPQGDFHSHFINPDTTAVTLAYTKYNKPTSYIASLNAMIPLRWGFEIQSFSYRQFDKEGFTNDLGSRSYNRLYFEQEFFKAPLTVRAHVSYDYLGPRIAYSDRGIGEVPATYLLGLRLSGTIKGVTLIWGVERLFDNYLIERPELMPGYLMIRKEDYFGVIWKLWL